jgi:trans-2,3-dihydro-3-hydroxyanthranilate isomerase
MQITRRSFAGLGLAGLAPLAVGGWTSQPTRWPTLSNGRRFLHYDVFTDRPLTGNQLAVFLEPQGLDVAAMAAMTRETNFSECTFVFPAEAPGTDIRLRIFGRNGEMPFAGHPVIGSTFALADTGVIAAGRREFVFGLGIGPTPVELEWKDGSLAFAWMTQQRPTFGQTLANRAAFATAIGLEPSALAVDLPIQEVSCGSMFLMIPLATRAAVDRVAPDGRALEVVFKEAAMTRRGLFVFSPEPGGDGATVYSRMIGGTFEDPATGSASGPLGSYLVRHGLVTPAAAQTIVSAQGVKMGRPSRVHIRIDGTAQEITRVRVGGSSVLVGEGRLRSS